MLDNPRHFVCHANGLQIGRPINPLMADEELDLGHLYFLLPMTNLHSVLSATDMASVAFKANSAMRAADRRSSSAKILPVFGDLLMRPLPPEMKTDDHLEDISSPEDFVLAEAKFGGRSRVVHGYSTPEIERVQVLEAKVGDHYRVPAKAFGSLAVEY